MPATQIPKTAPADDLFVYRPGLEYPVIGMEAEFELEVDGQPTTPEELWRSPGDFVDVPLLERSTKSSQLPTGGALYFDKGVLEIVTPVIEIAPSCTTRMVRSAWEQVGFVRHHLDRWQEANGRQIRLKAFSSHFNISYELSRDERNRDRTIQKLALLLAYILPVPVMILGANRRSSGVGVRPRRDRIEITFDFTPDPGLMLATAAFIVGVVRDVIAWPSYRTEQLEELPFELPAGADPGKHTTRKGWLARAHHFERSPFAADIDDPTWHTRRGGQTSLRHMAWTIARFFRSSIRKVSDPFSYGLLFSILEGKTPSLLDLPDRPDAYHDIGRSIRWGTVLPQLHNYSDETLAADHSQRPDPPASSSPADEEAVSLEELDLDDDPDESFPTVRTRSTPELIHQARPSRRAGDLHARLAPPWSRGESERRSRSGTVDAERRGGDRRRERVAFDGATIQRSRYEAVFIRLASGGRIQADGDIWVPVRMRGWYEADVVGQTSGAERRVSIDQLANRPDVWSE